MKINEIFGMSKDKDSWFARRSKLQSVTQGAVKQWQTLARANNLNLKTTDPAEQEQIKKHLQAVTAQYMSGGEYGNDKTAVVGAVAGIPLPDKLDAFSLNNYFADTAQARYNTLQKLKYALPGTEEPSAQEQPTQPSPATGPTPERPQQSTPTTGPLTGTGFSVFRAPGRSSGLILQQGKNYYAQQADGSWVNAKSGRPVPKSYADILNTVASKL